MMSAAMRNRHFLRMLVATSVLALAVAACGASDDPLASHRPTAVPSASSSPVPHAAPDLEARLPAQIAGTRLDHTSLAGASFLATGSEANKKALTAMLDQLGHTVDDLTLAEATDPLGDLPFIEGIFRVAGTKPEALAPAWIAAQQAATNHRLVESTVTVGAASLTKLTDPQIQAGGTTYVLPRGDSLVLIVADDQKLLEEAVTKVH